MEKDQNILLEELKKHDICRWFWSEHISSELRKKVELKYEPVGEMGVYSKYFEFRAPYCGEDIRLSEMEAITCIAVTAYDRKYDIHKAVAGTDCFHNVCVKVVKEKKVILTCRFRLWSGQKEEYTGDKSTLNLFLNH